MSLTIPLQDWDSFLGRGKEMDTLSQVQSIPPSHWQLHTFLSISVVFLRIYSVHSRGTKILATLCQSVAGSCVVGPVWGSDPLQDALWAHHKSLSLLTGLPSPCNAFQMCVKSDLEEPALGGNRLQGPAAHNNTD